MLEQIIVYLIIIFGLVNIIRITSYFVLNDIYDLVFKKNKDKKYYKPLVTIAIAAYNEEEVIKRCLDSVYNSIYKSIQIIVINDGSRDKTKNIVREYIKKNKVRNLILVNQKNSGKAVALNNGINNYATGSLVMTLDADSVIEPEAIKNAVKYFKNKNVVAVASNVRIFKSNTILGIIQYMEYLLGYKMKKAYSILNNEYIIGGIAATFRRNILKEVGYYDTDTVTEDIDLTLKILSRGNKKNIVIFGSDVVCFTEHVMSLKSLFRQRLRWKFGRFQTLYKNKNLFFNSSKKYSKMLTFLQLPFVLYSEFTFLLDPIFIGFMFYICLRYNDLLTMQAVFMFLGFFTFITIISDEYSTLKDKIIYTLLSPLAHIFFFVISVVEYIGLIKCLLRIQGILKAREINKCGWEHVERLGKIRSSPLTA